MSDNVIVKPLEDKIPPASMSWPECGLYNLLLKGTVYFVSAFSVGVKSLLRVTVVMLDVIASSVSSTNFVNAECLNAESNFVNEFVLKLLIVLLTLDTRVSCVFVVFFEL